MLVQVAVNILVHPLPARQRRMLLEMLAGERSGEDGLHIGPLFGRDRTADGLCDEGLASRRGGDGNPLVFTAHGRHVAERLA
ncbi:MAG: hypothetical protein JKY37_24995, partial [Nannocystaceae bacterium]|nr:hypothetical protein [Nannocystaceae bacterium]